MDLDAFKRLKGGTIAIAADPDSAARDLYAKASRARLPAEHDGTTVARKNPVTGAREAWVTYQPPVTTQSTDVKAALRDAQKTPKRKG